MQIHRIDFYPIVPTSATNATSVNSPRVDVVRMQTLPVNVSIEWSFCISHTACQTFKLGEFRRHTSSNHHDLFGHLYARAALLLHHN